MNKYKINFIFDYTKNINDILIKVLQREIRNFYSNSQSREIKH